ncbi:MAG: thiamine phosphate synthase [Chlorobium sp.]|jgi:thiamine-phosphate pyrophosphorylase|nr:thiamine phosphate synthase [Chlorobium sp.]
MIPSRPFLCVITDEALCPVTLAEQALKGGAAMIQLRHKTASGSQLLVWAVEIQKLCQQYQALCIINDRVDIALASKADGVHLGQQDLPARAARKLLGETAIIGVTASSLKEALQAEQDGADYIGFGHIYPTHSKLKESSPLGLDILQKTAALVSLPILAIGGINQENAASVISSGASGIAVISAISKANDPARAARELCRALNNPTL